MRLITLTTDWGTRDHFVGSLKGLLYSAVPEVTIVDISHHVSRHNIQQAAYLFRNAYTKFPEGTLHFIGVTTLMGNSGELIAIRHNGQYFIGMNDGLFSLVFDTVRPDDIVVINTIEEASPGFDLETIAYASGHLLHGDPITELGFPPADYRTKSYFQPVIEEEVLRGTVIYIDDFGNVITNITRQLFEEQARNRRFEIVTRKLTNSLNQIHRHYHELESGGMMALFNAGGYLEIAINQGSASTLLGLKLNDNIRIEFK